MPSGGDAVKPVRWSAAASGPVGSVYRPLLGSLLLTTIADGAKLPNVNPFWQLIITGR